VTNHLAYRAASSGASAGELEEITETDGDLHDEARLLLGAEPE